MISPTSTFLFLSAVSIFATSAQMQAQTAQPLDTEAAKATLLEPAKKPRFTPKSSIKSRTYTRQSKGAGIEIIEYEGGQKEERPYIAVPILFIVGKAELLDSVSAENVKQTAIVLRDIFTADPKAAFTIQGHTSAEGDSALNRKLSEERAHKIFSLLVNTEGLDGSRLRQNGFGSAFATAPVTAPEVELQQDRRVLIVRQ